MAEKLIAKKDLVELLNSLARAGKTLVAPVEEGGFFVFRKVEDAKDAAVGPGIKPRFSFKEFLFPKSEAILRYRITHDGLEVEDVERKPEELVIFGARPCDAASLRVLDLLFTKDYTDPFYASRRERTTVISVACLEPLAECFCTSVGLSPDATAGADILLTEISPDSFLVDILTEKGKRLFEGKEALLKDTDKTRNEVIEAAKKKMQRKANLSATRDVVMRAFERKDLWGALGLRCLQCGLCAFVCPTCHCFDIVDEGTATCGVRRKNWDSCGFEMCTLHTSGHNPRPSQSERCRQRLMHKFSYFAQRFGVTMCVGCGRCGMLCPVGIDIYEGAVGAASAEPEGVSK